MQKIVINDQFGGFSLSSEAAVRYGELKGLTIYPEPAVGGLEFFTVPPEGRDSLGYYEQRLMDREIPRDDAALVRVVQELGPRAGGRSASLKIVEIPDGIEWQIEEYDGREWVAEKHRTWD